MSAEQTPAKKTNRQPQPKTAPPKARTGDGDAAKRKQSVESSHSAQTIAKQFGRASGKQEWLLWLIAFGVLGALLGGWRLPAVLWYDGSHITKVIVILFATTLWKSWRDICFLDRETRLASQQVIQLQQLRDINRFVEDAKDSLFKSHIRSLHTIFRNDSQISQESLIEVLHARLVARNKVVDMFANVLITLGLIGTIVGLIDSIGGLEQVLGDNTVRIEELTAGINTSVGGLKTAFFTTLLGAVFGGVVLRILNGVVDANILWYVAHLAELTDVYVLPPMRKMARQLSESGVYARRPKGATAQ